ncbi:M23 family metallopeptidase [Antarcticibacterium arcticum]|uniref:M23 family metallopeptidase n=1 Tax=Antarcticibacterium arcticum TaxID=2585771 RepID=A0A5B8YJY0_9FLAO|nr:M23 family metallopeptidase [Antarcticibacterium arcticum]QED38310.1 M23 family metallopeptidase [Antarcticibacterium arcticum]
MQRWKLIIIPVLLLFFISCSQLNKATDLITNPTAKERYKRDLKISDELFLLWENQGTLALQDSVKIKTPYFQEGHFKPKTFPVLSYDMELKAGEKLDIRVDADSTFNLVFIDLLLRENDSLRTFKKVATSNFDRKNLSEEIEESGTYKVVIQPEINAFTTFSIKIETTPVYEFPVAGAGNKNIQSFWGANRDAGRRSHEGIDIFAARGTPVIAVTDGQISSSGERGLGGKQVWIRDRKRNQSLYYAHLDSIMPLANNRVKTGDTIGFVGNTGNARSTPPHLHFGLYKGYRGAIDPLPHVFQIAKAEFKPTASLPDNLNFVTRTVANLRDLPATKGSGIIANLQPNDTLVMLGKANDWYHIRTFNQQAGFIHESLIAPL